MITITEAAAARVQEILASRDTPCHGVRLGTSTKGCNGLSYTVEYVDQINPTDEKIEDRGITLFIDALSVIYLIGSEMDYKDEKFQSGFTFSNPNEKGRCGCGESFHV
ncbi:HesB/IscA family protein [Paremcibacter congregatus]|uniref:Fe-S cluster assembly scaffold SufA n=1 Tax=Paremcibacter congregatus TaxID=2043170 RepID=A0A2G4YPL1_9PROT|nr:iron-sulfur cluster assembly accessory protein [Paremcibacter congregatus]PHZ84227.1 Fe-S cluster assembly scaffold SufA [Paremcibacter congregatus]QDE29038.1 iron-sulfur cluster assembly accessory protein [Paremcibacter congregatus]|tara:strand:+ start:22693 stop:23016 length:324 start_codon:yes stop_codon:yes gene_type:complete